MAATATSSSLADDCSQLVTRLEEHFGPALVIMQVKGCASLICFKIYLPATLKLVEANDSDVVKDICHKIQAEVQSTSVPKTTAYKLGDFTKDSAVHNCSETLLTLLSSLVSNGKVSKKSLALAQAIQALVSRRFNQTTLGLALQIHHRSGSKELVDILYSNGFCCSYDEVKRFWKQGMAECTLGLTDGGSGTTAATDLSGDYCAISRRAMRHDLHVTNSTTLGALHDQPTADRPSLHAT